jgi:hypothetical protein
MKLFCFYTPSHSHFFKDWFKPSAEGEYDIVPYEYPDQISPTAKYSMKGWRETQYNKTLYWKKAVEDNMGDIIICADVDIQFLKKSKDHLVASLKDADIAFQQNQKGGKICSGFFVCRCSLVTQNFFEIVAKRLNKIMHIDGGGEQYEMQKLLEESWYGNKINVVKLSHDRIWTPGQNYEDHSELDIPEDIMVHHANWAEGKDAKLEQLEYVKSVFVQKNSPWKRVKNRNPSLAMSKDGPKIAICSSSLLRDYDVSATSLIERVIKTLPVKPDFIGHFPTQSKNRKNINTLNKIKDHCDKFVVKFDPDPPLDETHLAMTEGMTVQRHGIEGNLLQWTSMRSCAELLAETERKNGYKYDWVIWTRPDIYFYNSLENILNLDSKNFYVPAHDNHLQGLYDRFCLGSSDQMQERMHIYEYFTQKWYKECHNNKRKLTWNPYREKHTWNPELCLNRYLYKELKFKVKKLNICSGKIRHRFFATAPFWYSIYGTERTGYSCKDDIVNQEVLNRINALTHYKMYEGSPWHAVNVLEDTIMFDHPDKIKLSSEYDIPLEIKLQAENKVEKKGFLNKILHKIDEKILRDNE